MDRKEHWQKVFTTKGEQDVSWFEALPAMSLQMMESAGLGPETCVLDVGGGDSRLVDVWPRAALIASRCWTSLARRCIVRKSGWARLPARSRGSSRTSPRPGP